MTLPGKKRARSETLGACRLPQAVLPPSTVKTVLVAFSRKLETVRQTACGGRGCVRLHGVTLTTNIRPARIA